MVELHLVAHNTITGKFKLSSDAIVRLSRRGHIMATESLGKKRDAFDESKLLRHDPILVEVIQDLGKKASADGSSIWLERISNPRYKIKMFDGIEKVKELKEDVPGSVFITKDDHLSQYNFEGLEERLAEEAKKHQDAVDAIMQKAKELNKTQTPQECWFAFDTKNKTMGIVPKDKYDPKTDKLEECRMSPRTFLGSKVPEFVQSQWQGHVFWKMPKGLTQRAVRKEMEECGFEFSSVLQKSFKPKEE